MTTLLLALTFTPCEPIRAVAPNLPPIVADVESHLPANHPYRDADYITWTHEGSHAICSLLRQKYGKPGFYLLNNKAIILPHEPATQLSDVAAVVPDSLRGDVYNLYLIQQQRYWQNEPSYILDEQSAYINGGEARRQLKIEERGETVQYAVEFVVYSSVLAQVTNDASLKVLLQYQIERTVKLSGNTPYLQTLRTAADAEKLRGFMRAYYGRTWCKRILGL